MMVIDHACLAELSSEYSISSREPGRTIGPTGCMFSVPSESSCHVSRPQKQSQCPPRNLRVNCVAEASVRRVKRRIVSRSNSFRMVWMHPIHELFDDSSITWTKNQ